MKKNSTLLNRSLDAWIAATDFRKRRRRFKAFTYGRQWGDSYSVANGKIISEQQSLIENGRLPITNNLIRQLVKSIIGRYRYIYNNSDINISNSLGSDQPLSTSQTDNKPLHLENIYISELNEIDARGLEEFLISGCVIQRIDSKNPLLPTVANVSPERFFFHKFSDSNAHDCRFLGMLHDLPMTTIMRNFSEGNIDKINSINKSYQNCRKKYSLLTADSDPIDFYSPELPDTFRVIEVWEKIPQQIIRCHDRLNAEYFVTDFSDEAVQNIKKINTERNNLNQPDIFFTIDFIDNWHNFWLSPRGDVLWHETAENHPFAIKFYPLIDGEIHSLVEDVIDQQKYVNRLITMLDDIISSSAKGVLLYPTDQLPDGFTWNDIRKIWANPSGILPYKRNSASTAIAPHQINSPATATGATEMLKLQLQLFDEISGTSGALRGKASDASGVQMLRTEIENGLISMLDILAAFKAFVDARNHLLSTI